MKDLIKNDDAVSVVVGSILVLAVLVTFMSVVTSSWVPVYEGNAESAHSDDTHKTFMDLRKQIEFADEFSRSTAIDLGTDEMPFMSNTNSVGYLELNESDGVMALTSTIQSSGVGGSVGVGDSLNIRNLNLTQDAPIREFTFNFIMDTSYVYIKRLSDPALSLPDGFIVVLQSETPDRLKIIVEEVGTPYSLGRYRNEGMHLSVKLEYWDILGNVERWEDTWDINIIGSEDAFDLVYIGDYTYLDINMLSTGTLLYNSTGANETFHDLIQYYMKQPDAGTYDLRYIDYNKIVEGTQTLCYNTTTGGISGTSPVMDNLTIGGGTLTLRSDYNFFVDQSYIYDSGAIILNQNDGAVFKVGGGPIYVTNDSNNNLILNIKTTVLQGDYQAGGNGIETIRTQLDGSYYASGFTDNVTITKNTTPELSNLWNSYFEELNSTIYTTTNANSTYDNMTLHIWSNTSNILLTLEQKEIEVS